MPKDPQGGAPGRERVQLVQISTITFGLIRGLYRTSYWDYKPTYNWGGTTLQGWVKQRGEKMAGNKATSDRSSAIQKRGGNE